MSLIFQQEKKTTTRAFAFKQKTKTDTKRPRVDGREEAYLKDLLRKALAELTDGNFTAAKELASTATQSLDLIVKSAAARSPKPSADFFEEMEEKERKDNKRAEKPYV